MNDVPASLRAKAVADAADALQEAILAAEACGLLVEADAVTNTVDSVVFADGCGYRQTSTSVRVKVSQIIATGGK